jgi:MFS family permease
MLSESNRDARDYKLFLAATIFVGLGSCVNSSIFNNYLKDVFNLDVARRTFLELPRETPGFLVSLLVATLAALGEVRIAMVANIAASAGMMALGWIPASFILMVSSTFLFSAGQHVYMPLSSAIGMSFASEGKEGSALGRINATNTAAMLGGTLVLLGLLKFFNLSYKAAFSAGSAFYLAAALTLLAMSPRRAPGKPRRLVVKKRYARYYGLSLLYGARKQLFITFGPWMLVDLFRQGVQTMTLIALIASVATIGSQALAGRLTDRFGPRAVLGGEAFITVFVCLVYAFSPELLPAGVALVVVAACFVVDQASNAVGMARAIYARGIAENPADVSPTLSIGISIDHVASMTIPMIGGIAWMGGGARGYRWVFIGGAAIAALNFIVTRGMPRKGGARP